MLRRHPAPPVSNFDPLVKAAAARGFALNVNSSKELADSLDKAVDPSDPMINTVSDSNLVPKIVCNTY